MKTEAVVGNGSGQVGQGVVQGLQVAGDGQDRAAGAYGASPAAGVVRLERVLPGPIERVWAYLTESEKRRLWLAVGKMELRVGAPFETYFLHSELSADKTPPEKYRSQEGGVVDRGHITVCDPPHRLGFTWGEGFGSISEVLFDLTQKGDQVLLVVTHSRLPNRTELVGAAAGWHSHFDLLFDRLSDQEPRGFWTAFEHHESEYERRLPD